MRTIHEIKKEEQAKYDLLFKECGVFWAFSNEQFIENKTPLQEGDKYTSIGAGGYLPKSNVGKLTEGMKKIKAWHKAEIKKSKELRRSYILYALNNHECFYTGDYTDAFYTLGKGYTRKEVLKVYQSELEKNRELA